MEDTAADASLGARVASAESDGAVSGVIPLEPNGVAGLGVASEPDVAIT